MPKASDGQAVFHELVMTPGSVAYRVEMLCRGHGLVHFLMEIVQLFLEMYQTCQTYRSSKREEFSLLWKVQEEHKKFGSCLMDAVLCLELCVLLAFM